MTAANAEHSALLIVRAIRPSRSHDALTILVTKLARASYWSMVSCAIRRLRGCPFLVHEFLLEGQDPLEASDLEVQFGRSSLCRNIDERSMK